MATTATSCLAEESSADVIIQIAKPVLEQKKLYLITKRAFDIVCSSLGLLILAIPMLIIALLVTLDSPGSPIFKQERLGLHGKPFMIYKFRSMRLDAEVNGPQWADEQDGDYRRLPPPEARKCKQHAAILDLEHSYQRYLAKQGSMDIAVYTRSIR